MHAFTYIYILTLHLVRYCSHEPACVHLTLITSSHVHPHPTLTYLRHLSPPLSIHPLYSLPLVFPTGPAVNCGGEHGTHQPHTPSSQLGGEALRGEQAMGASRETDQRQVHGVMSCDIVIEFADRWFEVIYSQFLSRHRSAET